MIRQLLISLPFLALLGPAISAPVDFSHDPEAVFLGLDFREVWHQRDTILEANPNDPLALALVGRSWLEGVPTPDIAQAEALLTQAANMPGPEWKRAEGHLGLALAHWMQGDMQAALGACDQAAQLSPRSRARQEADLLRACMGMTLARTEHLVVFAPPSSAVASDLQAWAARREQAAQRIVQTLDITPWRPVRVVVCDNHGQAREILGHDLGYTDRPACVVYTRADQTPGHELTHALSVFLLPGHPWGGGPDPDLGRGRLLNEGLAVALDGSGRDFHREAAGILARARFVEPPSFALFDRDETSEEILYPLAGSFVSWLLATRGEAQFVQLWCHPGSNDEAAAEVYGTTLEQLFSEWINALPNL